jgi:hypothetical protein
VSLANCDCGSDRRVYYANIQLFGQPGPSGGGFMTGEVEVRVCPKCGKSQFEIPAEIRQRFVR